MRYTLITIILWALSISCFANISFVLPKHLPLSSDNPSQYFPAKIQSLFAITAESKFSKCEKIQDYILTMLVYRNAVDNKIVAAYRPANGQDICWIDLFSYSDQLLPDMNGSGWKPPAPSANTWCESAGHLCPIVDPSN